ncbi:MAG: ATP synthase subunit I [Thermodesulfobacteriota bacterium]|nr:ATP synthase subunit I [Thermodesulfobacteriota bacterium]
MDTTMNHNVGKTEQGIIRFVSRSNWILFGALAMAGLIYGDVKVAAGLICGGLIVTVNFHLMARTVKKAFARHQIPSSNMILAKYYMRFIASGLVLFVLIATHAVDPLGLVAGLSVVVASLFLVTLCEIKKILFREAV